MSPLQQVLSQAKQSRSHPLSGREGGRLIVVFLSSLLLDYKNGKCKLFLFVYFVQRLFAAACMDVQGPVMLTLQATW